MVTPLIRKALRLITIVGILWLGSVIHTYGLQDRISTPITDMQAGNTDNDFKIKVDVEEVQLDAVVVDGKGRQITDLTAEDFKIYQDKKRQEITSCRYISQDQPKSGKRISPSLESKTLPPIPYPVLKRDTVQRTVVFLVHDVSMYFDEVYYTRMALHKYVEEQMQSGDLISIFKTSRGSTTLQAFTSDKQELFARIDNIQWTTRWTVDSRIRAINAQTQAIQYCIKSLENMPGRKSIMLISPVMGIPMDQSRERSILQRIVDFSLRAGVVIHTLDIRGISTALPPSAVTLQVNADAEINPNDKDSDNFRHSKMYRDIRDRGSQETSYRFELSLKTGGLHLNNNWFVDGIGDIKEQLKGYYLLSYIPPDKTFSKSDKNKFHDIKIEVKRRGTTVHTRHGFFENPEGFELAVTPSPLVEAMFSPFEYNDLIVDLAAGYINNSEKGYLLPTWMHLDGKALGIIEEKDGSQFVSFKAAASTTDIDGIFQDYGDMQVKFPVDDRDIQRLRKNGINFTVSIPVTKPGGHYVRVAVEDQSSKAKGSAYQFIEIPDLKKKRLAISSLYIIDREEDASWLRSMATDESSEPSNASRQATYRNPARKDFLPGDSFEYMTVIYNAKTKKENPPDLEAQVILYRDGVELYTSEAEAVDLNSVSDYKRIPIRKKLHIEDSMQPGDYVLQYVVKDNNAKEKQSLTAQTLSFRVTASP